MPWRNGFICWIKDRTTPVFDDLGIAYRAIGIAEDIIDRKIFEQKLQESEAKFRTIADAIPQREWSTLPNGFHDYYNKCGHEFTGAPGGSTDGETSEALSAALKARDEFISIATHALD